MKLLLIFFILLSFTSCERKVIYYKCYNTIISRVDSDGEILLYYGDIEDNSKTHPYVKATYSGFNSGVSAYLLFNSNATVEVVNLMGYFTEGDNNNKQIYITQIENSSLDSLRNVHTQNGTLIKINDVLQMEKQRNSISSSKVVVEY